MSHSAARDEGSSIINDAWIVEAVRTPRGRGRVDGGLHNIHPQQLFAQCLAAAADRVGFDPADVDDVIAGNGIMSGEHGDDIARLAALLAGWPETVPGMTLNRFCGSGQQAVTVAAMGVGSGAQDLVVAGGVESMSRWKMAVGVPTIDGANSDFRQRYPTVPQGISPTSSRRWRSSPARMSTPSRWKVSGGRVTPSPAGVSNVRSSR